MPDGFPSIALDFDHRFFVHPDGPDLVIDKDCQTARALVDLPKPRVFLFKHFVKAMPALTKPRELECLQEKAADQEQTEQNQRNQNEDH